MTAAVEAVSLHRVRLPLLRPHVTAGGTTEVRDLTVVEVRLADGTIGWGECSALDGYPDPADRPAQACWEYLTTDAGPMLVGSTDGTADDDERTAAPPMARAAVDAACLDARLREKGMALAASIGGTRNEVDVSAVVSGASVDGLLAVVDRRVMAGYRWVSVKVDGPAGIGAVREVRRAFPRLDLCVDANGSLELDTTDWKAIDDLGLHHVEQPLAPSRDEDLPLLADRLGVPIAVDESVLALNDLDRLARAGGVAVVNLKPARVGGLTPALRLAGRARELGIDVFCGGMLESGIGRAHALAFAVVADDLPTHLGPSSAYFATDLTEPIELVEGDGVGAARLGVPEGPGTGVTVRTDVLARCTVDRVDLRRRSA